MQPTLNQVIPLFPALKERIVPTTVLQQDRARRRAKARQFRGPVWSLPEVERLGA